MSWVLFKCSLTSLSTLVHPALTLVPLWKPHCFGLLMNCKCKPLGLCESKLSIFWANYSHSEASLQKLKVWVWVLPVRHGRCIGWGSSKAFQWAPRLCLQPLTSISSTWCLVPQNWLSPGTLFLVPDMSIFPTLGNFCWPRQEYCVQIHYRV
jgi:hypothetical protein